MNRRQFCIAGGLVLPIATMMPSLAEPIIAIPEGGFSPVPPYSHGIAYQMRTQQIALNDLMRQMMDHGVLKYSTGPTGIKIQRIEPQDFYADPSQV